MIRPPHLPPTMFDPTPQTIEDRFRAFHEAHPEVYALLVRFAREMHRAGRPRIGISLLYERLRWEVYLAGLDAEADYKLNNDFRARYARLIMAQEPDLRGFITTRALRTP